MTKPKLSREQAIAELEAMGEPQDPHWLPPDPCLSTRIPLLLLMEKAKQRKEESDE